MTTFKIQPLQGQTKLSRCKKGIPGQVALNDPAQNPHLGNALNDPTLGKRVHSMTPSLKKIFLRHKKMKTSLKKFNPNKKK